MLINISGIIYFLKKGLLFLVSSAVGRRDKQTDIHKTKCNAGGVTASRKGGQALAPRGLH